MFDIFYTLSPRKLLALTAYGEAGGESTEGMMAILNVIINRTKDLDRFGDSSILTKTKSIYHAVILKPYQFSAFNKSDPVRSKLILMAKSFSSYIISNTALNKAYKLAEMAISGILSDNTRDADHYHSIKVRPSWSLVYKRVNRIGNHVFYDSSGIFKKFMPSSSVVYFSVGIGFFYWLYLIFLYEPKRRF